MEISKLPKAFHGKVDMLGYALASIIAYAILVNEAIHELTLFIATVCARVNIK